MENGCKCEREREYARTYVYYVSMPRRCVAWMHEKKKQPEGAIHFLGLYERGQLRTTVVATPVAEPRAPALSAHDVNRASPPGRLLQERTTPRPDRARADPIKATGRNRIWTGFRYFFFVGWCGRGAPSANGYQYGIGYQLPAASSRR